MTPIRAAIAALAVFAAILIPSTNADALSRRCGVHGLPGQPTPCQTTTGHLPTRPALPVMSPNDWWWGRA